MNTRIVRLCGLAMSFWSLFKSLLISFDMSFLGVYEGMLWVRDFFMYNI